MSNPKKSWPSRKSFVPRENKARWRAIRVPAARIHIGIASLDRIEKRDPRATGTRRPSKRVRRAHICASLDLWIVLDPGSNRKLCGPSKPYFCKRQKINGELNDLKSWSQNKVLRAQIIDNATLYFPINFKRIFLQRNSLEIFLLQKLLL